MLKFLPIVGVIAATMLFLFFGLDKNTGPSFQLTPLAADVAPLPQPNPQHAITQFQNKPLCSAQAWPFSNKVLASVYQVTLPAAAFAHSSQWVFFQKAAINNRFAVLISQPNGCLNVHVSGRSLPFNQRDVQSMFPNSLVDNLTSASEIFIVLQDSKSRNLWLGINTPQDFQELSNLKWIYSGVYLGTLLLYTLLGLSITFWQRSRLAAAYSIYTAIIGAWFLQNFGLGSAFLPFWPSEQYFPHMQAFFTGLIVIGMVHVCLLFMQPGPILSRSLKGFAAVVVVLFWSSSVYTKGYEYGALGLAILAIIVLSHLFKGLMRRSISEKLFALGLICSVAIGSLQAISVFTGSDFAGFAIFAFPIGNLFESTFWLMAIIERMFREFRKVQMSLLFDATHDTLTKLPNRTFVETRLKNIIKEHKNRAISKSMFLIDLDRFKQINDSLGHATGDNLLLLVSSRLRNLFKEHDTLARFGGDEFCLIVDGISSLEAAQKLGEQIIAKIHEPFLLVGRELKITASIGACLKLEDYPEAESIMRNADMSMYAAKENGRACTVIYNDTMHEQEMEKFQIEQDILPGLRKNEFEVYFQPIVHLPGGLLAGFEALVRWQHGTLGWMLPYRFIEVAENTGLIKVISEEVIQQVVDNISLWKKQGRWQEGLYISVNIAGQQLLDNQLQVQLEQHIRDQHIQAEDLRIEITESSLVTDFDKVANTLSHLKDSGFKILIDDFGTGYSSLKYLHQLPIDVLKIDRSFVTDIETNRNKQALIKSIIAMANELDLDVIAEGVEFAEHRDLLSVYGCAKAQGYFYDRPLSKADVEKHWLSVKPVQQH